MLSAEPLNLGSALVTGGLVQQEQENNSWKMQDRKTKVRLLQVGDGDISTPGWCQRSALSRTIAFRKCACYRWVSAARERKQQLEDARSQKPKCACYRSGIGDVSTRGWRRRSAFSRPMSSVSALIRRGAMWQEEEKMTIEKTRS